MVEQPDSCCELCETDMDWERTSQVPELGFLCQPAIPAARPRACWQRKFPELSTCNVTLITQRGEQKGGYWSRLLPLAVFLSFLLPLSFLGLSKLDLANRKQARKGQSSRFQLPTRLNTSVRACQEWLKWGRLPWQQLCHFATCICPMGEEEAASFLPPLGSFLTLLSRRDCPTRAH